MDTIYIMTYGRVNRQITYDNLPKRWQDRCKFVVQDRELREHTELGRQCLLLPPLITTIGPSRRYLIRYVERINNESMVLMLDDDLVFSARREDEPTKFRPMVDQDYDDMFDSIKQELIRTAHVSVSHREGANRNTDEKVHNSRYMRVLGYRTDWLRHHKIDHCRLPVMEDFDVNLQLLRKGMPSVILNRWVHNQGGSDTSGGCSHFRTPEVQAEAAEGLARLHPQFVKVVEKQTKTSWGGATRKDVRIQWKAAYESSNS